jgi:hypothetical protein
MELTESSYADGRDITPGIPIYIDREESIRCVGIARGFTVIWFLALFKVLNFWGE